MTTNARGNITFRFGDAFPATDPIAKYVLRLSTALGDLRVIVPYLTREDQPTYERLYFIRLSASHLHELAVLFQKGDPIPTIGEFVAATRPDAEDEKELRERHRHVCRYLQRKLKPLPGTPTVGAELSRLRNDFFHYHYEEAADARLETAMHAARDIQTSYDLRGERARAEYADEVAGQLVHPWLPGLTDEDPRVRTTVKALHDSIVGVLKPAVKFLHLAEAAYLASRPDGALTVVRDD